MLNLTTIPARNLQKSYKAIIQGVKNGKQAIVLTTNNQPQAAIVSLEDLEEIRKTKNQKAALAMLQIAASVREDLSNLPKDLRALDDKLLKDKYHV